MASARTKRRCTEPGPDWAGAPPAPSVPRRQCSYRYPTQRYRGTLSRCSGDRSRARSRRRDTCHRVPARATVRAQEEAAVGSSEDTGRRLGVYRQAGEGADEGKIAAPVCAAVGAAKKRRPWSDSGTRQASEIPKHRSCRSGRGPRPRRRPWRSERRRRESLTRSERSRPG